jgi:hypothetical protein
MAVPLLEPPLSLEMHGFEMLLPSARDFISGSSGTRDKEEVGDRQAFEWNRA